MKSLCCLDCPFAKKTAPDLGAVIFESIRKNQLSLGVLAIPFDIVNIVKYRVIS
jgi:hypothetical protein